MQLSINNQQSPAFQAKLKIKGFNMPNSEQICQKFEKLTQHYKSDELEISAGTVLRGDNSTFRNTDFKYNGKDVGYMVYLRHFKNFCKKHTPDEVAKSLTKIFKQSKFNEVTDKKIAAIERNLNSAYGSLFRAQNRPDNKVTRTLISNNQARIDTLKEQLRTEHKKMAEITDKIWGNDPILEKYFPEDC